MKQIKQMGTMSTDKHMQKHIQKNHIHLPPHPLKNIKNLENFLKIRLTFERYDRISIEFRMFFSLLSMSEIGTVKIDKIRKKLLLLENI